MSYRDGANLPLYKRQQLGRSSSGGCSEINAIRLKATSDFLCFLWSLVQVGTGQEVYQLKA
jgi:hypothetical protein